MRETTDIGKEMKMRFSHPVVVRWPVPYAVLGVAGRAGVAA
jgi:hypothetical protein